jgi:predicted metal-binding membrane protein
MSRTVLVEVITPIVVAIALAAWIIAIYRANRMPLPGTQPGPVSDQADADAGEGKG